MRQREHTRAWTVRVCLVEAIRVCSREVASAGSECAMACKSHKSLGQRPNAERCGWWVTEANTCAATAEEREVDHGGRAAGASWRPPHRTALVVTISRKK